LDDEAKIGGEKLTEFSDPEKDLPKASNEAASEEPPSKMVRQSNPVT
jgi:hypothetical protein